MDTVFIVKDFLGTLKAFSSFENSDIYIKENYDYNTMESNWNNGSINRILYSHSEKGFVAKLLILNVN